MTSYVIAHCAYCGESGCISNLRIAEMCTRCWSIYNSYKTHKCNIKYNGVIVPDKKFLEYQDYYIKQRELGFKVPMDFRKDGKNETM